MATVTERIYELVTNEDAEGHACEAIPDEACREVPRNFLLNLANGSATKLAEQLASPGLVLAWMLGVLSAPVAVIGFLEPVRQGGSLLPQLAVSGRMRSYARRKWFWAGAGIVQAGALISMLAAAATLTGLAVGVTVVGALAVFSVASGIGSVAFKDVMGKTIPKGKRGQLLGLRSSIGGALTLGAGLFLYAAVADTDRVGPFLYLLGIAAVLWALAAALFGAMAEQEGAVEGSRNALAEARAGFGLLSSVPGFRRFILARVFLLSAELSVPFYTLRARELTGASRGLGIFIVALGLAALLSSPFWGRFADGRSNRLVMGVGGAMGASAAALALLLGAAGPGEVSPYLYALVFFLVGMAQAGIRVGRKSYLVDAAPADERPLYTAVSNTTVGVMTLAFGFLGLIGQVLGVNTLLAVLLGLGLLGAAASWYMPEAGRMV